MDRRVQLHDMRPGCQRQRRCVPHTVGSATAPLAVFASSFVCLNLNLRAGKIHSVLGCGKGFKWDKARPYKARFQKFDPRSLKGTSKVQVDGVVMPARMCRVCFDTIRQGTCFEELSPTTNMLSCDPTALFEFVARHGSHLVSQFPLFTCRGGPHCSHRYAMLKTFRTETNIKANLFGNHDSGVVAALMMLVGSMRTRPMELPIDGKPFTGGHFGCAALRPPRPGRSTQTCETCGGKCVVFIPF